MSTEEYRAIRNQVQRLSLEEQFRLLDDLVAILKDKCKPQHSTSELEGLGKEVREGINVEDHNREIRVSHRD